MTNFSKNFYDYIIKSKELHESDNDVWSGVSLMPHIKYIEKIIKNNNLKTILDYGCGKALYHKNGSTNVWNYDELFLYDPCVVEYENKPVNKKFDLVICTDVLEHIPETDIDEFINELIYYTNKFLFVSISTRKAKRHFPDGKNVHLTIMDDDWWINKLKSNKKDKDIVIITSIEKNLDTLGDKHKGGIFKL